MTNTNVLGIVAEYNPMHNGHIFQLEKCKEKSNAEFTVAVISGNFTQRGEPALLDKWTRTEMAILGGVDLVLELPFYFACNSAEYFAKGAVQILNGLGAVTHMGFGSESGDIEQLQKIADVFLNETEETEKKIKENLSKGLSFPAARQLAFGEEGDVINHPNNILAIEYLKALKLQNSTIEPITVKRHKAAYHDRELTDGMGSGTGIREALQKGNTDSLEGVPDTTCDILKKNEGSFVFSDNQIYFDLLKYAILRSTKEELAEIFAVGEGIENKILKEIRHASNLQELIERVKSKRYTQTRIQRIFAHILVNMDKKAKTPDFIKVLGFNHKGAKLLKTIKKAEKNTMPIVTNTEKVDKENMTMDIRATDIYNLISKKDTYTNSDFVKKPVIIGEV